MDTISNVQTTATAIWLTIALLGTGCDSSPDLLKATEEYLIIITEEDTNRDRLDELFAEFTATYGFIRQARRHPVLGTLTGFTQYWQGEFQCVRQSNPPGTDTRKMERSGVA